VEQPNTPRGLPRAGGIEEERMTSKTRLFVGAATVFVLVSTHPTPEMRAQNRTTLTTITTDEDFTRP
jgi:hypothetical protein